MIQLLSSHVGPDDANVVFLRLSLAEVLLYKGRHEDGNRIYRSLTTSSSFMESEEDRAAIFIYILDRAARINWEIERYEESEEFFGTYLKLLEDKPNRDTSRVYNDLANFYWHINQPKKAEDLYDSQRTLDKPNTTTSKTLITSSCRIHNGPHGIYYELKLRLRIKRLQGVRDWILPIGSFLEIKFENLEKEEGPDSDQPDWILGEKRIDEEIAKTGEFVLKSSTFTRIIPSGRKNFEVAINVWNNTQKSVKMGEHHQLVSTTSIPY